MSRINSDIIGSSNGSEACEHCSPTGYNQTAFGFCFAIRVRDSSGEINIDVNQTVCLPIS
jgi:hypothetical protein